MTSTELVPTPTGDARVTWYRADQPRVVLALGHGASTGIDAPDLRALATGLPARGTTVALVEQPWLVARGFGGRSNEELDAAWRAVWPVLAKEGLPVIAGGRSAGSRVAGRTARDLGADAVLALSFPLHAPGRPDDLWDTGELFGTAAPTLIVQGGADEFGRPAAFPPLPAGFELVAIPGASHVFSVPGSQGAALSLIVGSVADWIARRY
jgi:predicted alpha/beta-hydrolase family hydrolase